MADILRVTTPLVNKSQMVETKPNVDLATQYPIQDPTRVPRPGNQSELLGQNNGMLQQDETSALLLSLVCYCIQDFFGLGLCLVSPLFWILLGLSQAAPLGGADTGWGNTPFQPED